MDDTKKLSAGQIAAIIDRLKSKRVTTKYGTGYDGRFLTKYFKHKSSSTRDRSEPIIRGQLAFMMSWTNVDWMPGVQFRPALLEFNCPFCDQVHRHSWDYTFAIGRYMSYRGAHCGDHKGKRVRKEGYWIAPFRKRDVGYESHVLKPGIVLLRKAVG